MAGCTKWEAVLDRPAVLDGVTVINSANALWVFVGFARHAKARRAHLLVGQVALGSDLGAQTVQLNETACH